MQLRYGLAVDDVSRRKVSSERISMSKLVNGLNRFFKEEEAPTMVEYGLLSF
jgi:hypothetical protein